MSLSIVKSFFEYASTGNFPTALALFSEDARIIFHGPKEIPMAGQYNGIKAISAMFASIPATLEVEYFAPHEFIDAGNTVVVLGRERSKVKASGQTFDTQFSQVWKTDGNKIIELIDYFDTGTMLKAFVALN